MRSAPPREVAISRFARLRAPQRSTAPAPLGDSVGRIPRGTRVYDRVAYLRRRASGRSVIHLGFVDARNMAAKVQHEAWLHAQIAEEARDLVGLDASPEGVDTARALGFMAHVADAQSRDSLASTGVAPADLVLAGEVIEHLDRPGDFLDAVRQLVAPGGELVITTPNPYALTNVVMGLLWREVQNSDHVGWHSWRTLEALLRRHGFAVTELAYYRHPKFDPASAATTSARLRCRVFNTYESLIWPLFAIAPALADGVIVVAKPLAEAGGTVSVYYDDTQRTIDDAETDRRRNASVS